MFPGRAPCSEAVSRHRPLTVWPQEGEAEWRFAQLSACCRQETSGCRGSSRARAVNHWMPAGCGASNPEGAPMLGGRLYFLSYCISFIYRVLVFVGAHPSVTVREHVEASPHLPPCEF